MLNVMTPEGTKPLPLIYISGPFRGPTPLAVRHNVEDARDLGLLVAQCGGYPVIPHTMTADFDKLLTDQFWLDGTMELLRRCDAIMLSGRWYLSKGAIAEAAEAERRRLPQFKEENVGWDIQLANWITTWQRNKIALAAAAPTFPHTQPDVAAV